MLSARWSEFNSQLGQWIIKPVRVNINNVHIVSPLIACLSRAAKNVLDELHRYSGSGEFLFPSLVGMKKTVRDQAIANQIQTIWPHYLIDLNGFRLFFADVASKNSQFKPAFIAAAMCHSGKNLSESYILQRRALAECWAIELLSDVQKFNSSAYSSL